METISPPPQKKKPYQQKTATFFVLLQRTVWQGDLSHPSHQGGAAFSLWPGCRLTWIDGWIGLES